MENENLVKIAHVIANENPQKCVDEVSKFCAKYPDTTMQKQYSTTPLITGVDNLRRAQTIIITTCLIVFQGTEEQKKALQTEIKIVR